ncbi:hypothetical protein K493DRAFT_308653 [Basidiobolus meristosporus CBS 931.73]|uniref:DUF642 domain-containing protein n=1 Tax=Basidiobolus meristosporus CBS 931.73 TaxID=1314790 RepID=A0A1Y1WYU7_9FUNG|nr:hypothetical protein K493DRAFT_308653 [Basidiobolus meristosporus CBS 931.73]|eukprot:ORX78739.1 hypothetical protein K493DRAFT_308653 [Basidiobolus meristosporus CBS 931.73]
MKTILPLVLLPVLSSVAHGMSMNLENSLPGWNFGPITSFESDIEVPSGNDGAPGLWSVVGFEDGYFGLQAYSDSKRLATFSLFDLGESQKAEIAGVGRNVIYQNSTEKSGKQAIMDIDWQPGQRYRLRVDAIHLGQDTVFKATILIENQWQFMANITGKNFGSYNMWNGGGIHQRIDDMWEDPSQTRTGIFGRQCYRIAGGDFCYPNWGGKVTQTGSGYCWGSGLAGEGNAIFLSVGGSDPWPESCNYSDGVWLQYDNCAMDRLASEMNRKL